MLESESSERVYAFGTNTQHLCVNAGLEIFFFFFSNRRRWKAGTELRLYYSEELNESYQTGMKILKIL